MLRVSWVGDCCFKRWIWFIQMNSKTSHPRDQIWSAYGSRSGKKHLQERFKGTSVYFFASFIRLHSFVQNWEESPQPLVFGRLCYQQAEWIFLSSDGPRRTSYPQLRHYQLVSRLMMSPCEWPRISLSQRSLQNVSVERPGPLLAVGLFAEVCTWWEGTQRHPPAARGRRLWSGVGGTCFLCPQLLQNPFRLPPLTFYLG